MTSNMLDRTTRMSPPARYHDSVSTGSTRFSGSPLPAGGSQLSQTANTKMNTIPSQNEGKAFPRTAMNRTIRSPSVPRFIAE